jgi:hypothetical protein
VQIGSEIRSGVERDRKRDQVAGGRKSEKGREQAKRGKGEIVLLQYVTISPPMEKIACPHASLKLTISIVNTQNSLIRNKHK